MNTDAPLKIAVVGTGISGLSAAWLLSRRHDVTVYERADRIGGHSNTIVASIGGRSIPVDTGFIVFNRRTYPNMVALLAYLQVPTEVSDMSFAVSLDEGAIEYSGSGPSGLFAQPGNLLRPRFWSMLRRSGALLSPGAARRRSSIEIEQLSSATICDTGRYGDAFREDHILPMASAIWSAPPAEILSLSGGSVHSFPQQPRTAAAARTRRLGKPSPAAAAVMCAQLARAFRRADQARHRGRQRAARPARTRRHRFRGAVGALRPCRDGDACRSGPGRCWPNRAPAERELFGAFRYSRNLAVLHADDSFMPKRRAVWSSWNYIGTRRRRAAWRLRDLLDEPAAGPRRSMRHCSSP